jgi:hypothetical protein
MNSPFSKFVVIKIIIYYIMSKEAIIYKYSNPPEKNNIMYLVIL